MGKLQKQDCSLSMLSEMTLGRFVGVCGQVDNGSLLKTMYYYSSRFNLQHGQVWAKYSILFVLDNSVWQQRLFAEVVGYVDPQDADINR